MTKHLLLFLALPFVARAETLYVQYEGQVLNLDERGGPVVGYRIGDRVSGTLLIDTLLATPNIIAPPPHEILHYGGSHEGLTNFVTGFARGGVPAADFVGIERGPMGTIRYDVVDGPYPRDSGRTISISASSPNIKEVALSQTIDVKQEEPGSILRGAILLGKGAGDVLLRLTRMSVTPGQCRP